jgi:hypothetical protein
LQKKTLQARFFLWIDEHHTIVVFIHVAQLVDVIDWNEAGMERQLA